VRLAFSLYLSVSGVVHVGRCCGGGARERARAADSLPYTRRANPLFYVRAASAELQSYGKAFKKKHKAFFLTWVNGSASASVGLVARF
jgi:hypothetical protein